jgi:regulator of nucleoside diphosphate kinase
MRTASELLVSAVDAEALASVVGKRFRTDPLEVEAVDALADILLEAPLVAHSELPADRVAMNARVSYREEPGGRQRTVTLVHPAHADPALGLISVLSPVGRSLLGRRSGSIASVGIPGGRDLKIRILDVEREPGLSLEAVP